MIKLLTFLKGRPPMTAAQLKQRWLEVHAPMALKFPGLLGYMLSFPVNPEAGPPADAVAQLWFESREATQASYASDIGRSGSADANAYLSRRQHMLASESWLKNDSSLNRLPFKYLLGVKRRPGTSRESFVDWWRETFAKKATSIDRSSQARICYDEKGQMLNSGTAGSLELMSGEAPFDGLYESWFPSRTAVLAAASDPTLTALCQTHGAGIEAFVLEEYVMRQPPYPAYGKVE